MKSYIFTILSTALFVAQASAQLVMYTPFDVVSCEPLQIQFFGGTPPYIISVHNHSSIDTLLLVFSNVTSSPFNWTSVNSPPGTTLLLSVRDSAGEAAQSYPFTIQPGGGTSCLNGTVSGSNDPATGTRSSGSSTSTGASPSSSGNAAIVPGIPYGVAGVLGAVVAAIIV